MKKLGILVLFLSVIMAAGCSKDDTEEADKNPTLTIETSNYTIAAEGGSLEASFEVNVNWMASVKYVDSDANWLTLNPEYGNAGKATLTMIAEPNPVTAERKASVRILYGGQTPCVLSVVQSGLSETDITADFDSIFVQELQKRGYIADAKNITLEEVKKITKLDVSGKWVSSEQGYDGKLTSLCGIEYFESLTELYCTGNQLTTLDISKNTALTRLACENNPGDGSVFPVTAWFDNNSIPNNFTTGSWDYDGKTVRIDYRKAGTNPDTGITADFDPLFAQELQKRGYIADAKNITLEEVKGITKLDVSGEWVSSEKGYRYNGELTSLRGIEYFESLTELYCTGNQLTALDVSKKTMLTTLCCGSNQLTTLDVSKNTALVQLDCSNNQLTTLDVSKNTGLKWFYCGENQLTTLDVSKNTALNVLYCTNNQLTALDVSKNTVLTELRCPYNHLTTLDVSKNTVLIYLECYYNQLTALDVSKNTELRWFYCNKNHLTALDVSKNTALTDLQCGENQLTTLDVSNNTVLTDLQCGENQLTTLDVSKNTALKWLFCNKNHLTTLDVSKNTALTDLDCYENHLTALDVSKNTALADLDCYENHLTTLDVSKNTALTHLQCGENHLTTLDVSKNTALTWFVCKKNPGNGTVFPVTAWFDNNSIPNNFTTGSWDYDGKTVRIDYRKAE